MKILMILAVATLPAVAVFMAAGTTFAPAQQPTGVPSLPPRVAPATAPQQQPPQQPQPPVAPNQAPASPPQPAPTTPPVQPAPGQPVPGQPVPGQPVPGQPAFPADALNPVLIDPTDPRLTPQQREAVIRLRAARPFSFQSPQAEAIFYDGIQHLVRDEQRFATASDDHLRMLGEVRGLTGERQTAALFDLLQQVLISNKELQQYLVRSRTAWTGEMPSRDANRTAQPR